jgi:hypothetical protein
MLCGCEINSLRDFLKQAFCYEFEPLKKLWKETYTTDTSWMASGPLFRIRDEGIRGEIASIEVSLLVDDACLLRATFVVQPRYSGKLPKLVLNSISSSD